MRKKILTNLMAAGLLALVICATGGCHALAGAGHDLTRVAKFSQRAIDSQVIAQDWDPHREAR